MKIAAYVQSLQAPTILTRVEKELGISVHSRVLAEHPTIAEQAAYIDRHAVSFTELPSRRGKATSPCPSRKSNNLCNTG
jgi:Phosphopantetheine attachment site